MSIADKLNYTKNSIESLGNAIESKNDNFSKTQPLTTWNQAVDGIQTQKPNYTGSYVVAPKEVAQKLTTKGKTMLENLVVEASQQPTETINIVENGLVDVAKYKNANVQVPSPPTPQEYSEIDPSLIQVQLKTEQDGARLLATISLPTGYQINRIESLSLIISYTTNKGDRVQNLYVHHIYGRNVGMFFDSNYILPSQKDQTGNSSNSVRNLQIYGATSYEYVNSYNYSGLSVLYKNT